MLNEEARLWLEQHKHDLDPEEIQPTEEALNIKNSVSVIEHVSGWPIPNKHVVFDNTFMDINGSEKLTSVLNNIKLRSIIAHNSELYCEWILPHAVLVFGKQWFEKVKWKHSIGRGIPFPLFDEDTLEYARKLGVPLELTATGMAKIAIIKYKIDKILKSYINDSSLIVNLNGYMVESIKNDLVRETAKEFGYKMRTIPACPCCISRKINKSKVIVTKNTSRQYSCPRCISNYENLKLQIENVGANKELTDALNTSYNFINFSPMTCICPSDNCVGKFVPISCSSLDSDMQLFIESNWNRLFVNGVSTYKVPPEEMLHMSLKCPYCDVDFTIKEALEKKGGFKNRSGYITGIPNICIWRQPEISEQEVKETSFDLIYDSIDNKQRLKIIIDEVLIKMSKLNQNSCSDLVTFYFYKAAIEWIDTHIVDAINYFFNYKQGQRDLTEKEHNRKHNNDFKMVTNVTKGDESAIHLTIFRMWMRQIELNIGKFNKLNNHIYGLENFKWFCSQPKFSGGPKSIFLSAVDSNMKVACKSGVKPYSSFKMYEPRMAKIYSIFKVVNGKVSDDKNFIDDVTTCEWNSVRLDNNSVLEPGDSVQITALIISGHPSHAPFQRITRLRNKVLMPIIEKLSSDNLLADVSFWAERNKLIDVAKLKLGEI